MGASLFDEIFGYAKRAELFCEQPNGSYSGYNNTYTVVRNWYDYSDANYPAFAKAINYHAPGTTNENTYYSGWFLPTWRELQRLVRGVDENKDTLNNSGRANLSTINSTITSIKTAGANGAKLLSTSEWIWSSSQGTKIFNPNKAPWIAYRISFESGIGDSEDYNESKLALLPVVVMRALDD